MLLHCEEQLAAVRVDGQQAPLLRQLQLTARVVGQQTVEAEAGLGGGVGAGTAALQSRLLLRGDVGAGGDGAGPPEGGAATAAFAAAHGGRKDTGVGLGKSDIGPGNWWYTVGKEWKVLEGVQEVWRPGEGKTGSKREGSHRAQTRGRCGEDGECGQLQRPGGGVGDCPAPLTPSLAPPRSPSPTPLTQLAHVHLHRAHTLHSGLRALSFTTSPASQPPLISTPLSMPPPHSSLAAP